MFLFLLAISLGMDIKSYIEGKTGKPIGEGTLKINHEYRECTFTDMDYYARFIGDLGVTHVRKKAGNVYFKKKLMDKGVPCEWCFVIAKEPFEERFTLEKVNNTMDRFNGECKIK